MNRPIRQYSPDERARLTQYVLDHVDNPVDWWPWSEEAFEQARRREQTEREGARRTIGIRGRRRGAAALR